MARSPSPKSDSQKSECNLPSLSLDDGCQASCSSGGGLGNGDVTSPTPSSLRDEDDNGELLTVLMEATFRELDEESLYGYYVTVIT